MKLVKTTFLALVSCGMTLAQNTSLDSLAVSTNYLDEVVVTDSRFALKRSQSGKTVVKINSEEIQQFSGLGLGVLLSTQLGREKKYLVFELMWRLTVVCLIISVLPSMAQSMR